MTDRETLEILEKLHRSVLMDLGDLRALSAITDATAAYRRELAQSEAEKAETTALKEYQRKLQMAKHHIEHLADRITNYKTHTPTDREETVKAGLNWVKEAGL